jgi:hypothetical protein
MTKGECHNGKKVLCLVTSETLQPGEPSFRRVAENDITHKLVLKNTCLTYLASSQPIHTISHEKDSLANHNDPS